MCEAGVEYSYDEIDELVIRYQNGDKDAAQSLIRTFKPYMSKFLKILKDGLINLDDKDSRKFIRLFIGDYEARKKLLKVYQPTDTRHKAYNAAAFLQDVCKEMSYEDIMQELSMILLIVAKRWKKKGKKINFCGYLYNTFRFEVYRRFKSMIEEPLVYRADVNLSYNDESYINEIEEIENDPRIYTDELMMLFDEELGNSWIRGLTCDDIFADLTPFQRLILKMKYVDNKSDVEIANRTGIHRNTIRRHRERAELILKEKGENNEYN
jgi:RNA polymerase sigma factor (sigma-70 family)